MEFRIEHIAGKTCRIWTCGHDGSVIYWGTARRDDNEETAVAELLKEMTKGKSWTLVAYEVESGLFALGSSIRIWTGRVHRRREGNDGLVDRPVYSVC